MKPVSHASNTRVLQPPAGWDQSGTQVEPLGITDIVYPGDVPAVMSFWEPDDVDRANIASGGLVGLSIIGRTMQPAVVVSLAPSERPSHRDHPAVAIGIEDAARWVDARREAFDSEHGMTDPETGAFEYGTGHNAEARREYSAELSEIAEGIRCLKSSGPLAGTEPVSAAQIKIARSALTRLCEEGHVRMSVPVDRIRDEDFALAAVIDAAEGGLVASAVPSRAILDVLAERRRQVEVEGWTPEHDDEHAGGGLAFAAAAYATHSHAGPRISNVLWAWTGWATTWWKPKNVRHDLVRAGALIVAELERLDRAAARAISEGRTS